MPDNNTEIILELRRKDQPGWVYDIRIPLGCTQDAELLGLKLKEAIKCIDARYNKIDEKIVYDA